MKSLLLLRNIQIENANAIAGLTYGFPAISHFLGFSHALSRQLQQEHGIQLGGCAVICHDYQVCAYQLTRNADFTFTQTRNPLTKEAKSPPFVEEGRMHLEVSLLIECDFTVNDFDFGTGEAQADIALFEAAILQKVLRQKLAGGSILALRRHKPVSFIRLPDDSEDIERLRRKLTRQLMPGFALVQRSDLLAAHCQQLQTSHANTETIDALLDFVAYKEVAQEADANGKVQWRHLPKPADGWLVPIYIGFQAISPLYAAGSVANARDKETPFRLVESLYSLGEWLGPHRITELEQFFWRYRVEGERYLCHNNYQSSDTND